MTLVGHFIRESIKKPVQLHRHQTNFRSFPLSHFDVTVCLIFHLFPEILSSDSDVVIIFLLPSADYTAKATM
uniref:Uncharacterized protein n=1 Tax=Nelumbo nucifera TaxID=4432 RepID=A0A822Z305_NELNU|nr:TPA_asm: hypothetical protein HUJ06_008007 [Nelumbo nucifera]